VDAVAPAGTAANIVIEVYEDERSARSTRFNKLCNEINAKGFAISGENERINELIAFIRKNKFRTLEYDDKLVRKIIQSVTVYEGHFVISFKSGIEMEICTD